MSRLINPTQHEIDEELIKQLKNKLDSITTENFILKRNNENLKLQIDWYRNRIEKARQAWRIGDNAESAFIELLRKEK